MSKIVIEVGSTNTKIDEYNDGIVKRLTEVTIGFKQHYNEQGALNPNDISTLINKALELKKSYDDIYVCGTSIFRDLPDEEKKQFLDDFLDKTGLQFNIISQEKENELTMLGATRFVEMPVCVLVGGGGSTEISIFDHGITETKNTNIGCVDIMEKFPDLAADVATTPLETVVKYIQERLNLPEAKTDVLILAGGDHETFARESGVRFQDNALYNDNAAPIMMTIEMREADTKEYFEKTSLEAIKKRVSNPDWWFSTRAMCAFVIAAAEKIGAKYIVPTNISMVYGIISQVE